MEDVRETNTAAHPQRFEWDAECYNPRPRLVDDIQQGDLCKYVSPFKEDSLDEEMMMVIDVRLAADLLSELFAHGRPDLHITLGVNGLVLGHPSLARDNMLAHCLTSVGMKWIPCKRLKIV